MRELSDQEIIEKIKTGSFQSENAAIRFLYFKYYPKIEWYILKNNGTKTEAADVFQDSMIVLYHRLKQDATPLQSSIWTYLYSVCRNTWLKKMRTKGRVVSITEKYATIPSEGNHPETLIQEERAKFIQETLKDMKEDCKKILLFYYFDKLPMKTIAKKMKFSNEQVAKNKKYNCLKTLKKNVLAKFKSVHNFNNEY